MKNTRKSEILPDLS